MSLIKSFSVNNGDMFYIFHDSDNFTIIDCNLISDKDSSIIQELKKLSKRKNNKRFISTHPDEDHIHGLEVLDKNWGIDNFYCVDNNVTKKDKTSSFIKYCELRNADISCNLYKGLKRCWLNRADEKRNGSGLSILWSDVDNEYFKKELDKANAGESPNNISPIVVYKRNERNIAIWMGDLETDYMDKIKNDVCFEKTHILFAPHHGRESGKIPKEILDKINPDIIVIGEAPSDKIDYYSKYNTITQNTAKDIVFECDYDGRIYVYVDNPKYKVGFLKKVKRDKRLLKNYLGYIDMK